MLTIYADTDDVSASYERESLRITEQMNNRRNTCQFSTLGTRIDEGSEVWVYDTMELRQGSSSGTDTLYPVDTYEFQEKFRAGDLLYVDIGGSPRKYIIDSVDHSAREIVLTTNLRAAVLVSTKCGKLAFGGILTKPDEEEVGNEDFFTYKHSLEDWSALFDLKNIATTFMGKYPREMVGRAVRGFVALDSYVTLDSFEAAWTAGGVARAMADETTDIIEGNKSQKTGITGAGTATWTKAVTPGLDDYTHVRFWWKIAADNGGTMTALKLRIGDDSSNYFEYDIPRIGADYEDCWNYEAVELLQPDSTTGSPDLSTADWVQLVVVGTGSIAAGDLLFDHMLATNGGFTLSGVQRGNYVFDNYPVVYVKPTAFMEDVAKRQGMYWFIDREKDIHLFAAEGENAPFDINTTDQNWGDLRVQRDLGTLRNRVQVRGAETISESLYTQIQVADGQQTSFPIDYKASGLQVFVDTGSGYVEKTVGVENLDDPADFEFMMNFQEKIVKNSTASTLSAGHKIKFTYYPYIPIRVQVVDIASVNRMKLITGGDGIYDGPVITDDRIKSFDDARQRAQVELDLYSNAVVTCTFQTNKEGLHAGQVIHISDPARNIDDDYVIQQLQLQPVGGAHDDTYSYDVTAASSLFGLIEFFQLLLKRTGGQPNDLTEGVEVVYNVDDAIALDDEILNTIKSKTFHAGDLVNYQIDFGYKANVSKSATGVMGDTLMPSWYGTFGGAETGSFGIQASHYNKGKEMFLTTAGGGAGKSLLVRNTRRYRVNAGETYTIRAWIELRAALTNVNGGGGFRLRIIEYANQIGGSALQTTTIFSGETALQDFYRLSTTHAMHASAGWVTIELGIYEAAGTVRIGEVHLIESNTDGQTNPAVAGFAEAS